MRAHHVIFRGLAVFALLVDLCGMSAHAAIRSEFSQFGFSGYYRCELRAGGAVQCQSESNYLGQSREGLGGGPTTFHPVQIIAHDATKLVAGNFATCAIVAGALDCWTRIALPGSRNDRPSRVIASGVTDVAVGDGHACAVVNGAVQCWGSNFTGESGHGDYQTGQPTPWTVIERNATAVAAGKEQSCAIVDDSLRCWGRTGLERDQMDVAFGGGRPSIQVIAHGVSGVAAGSHHTCAIVEAALWCWGDNSHGQIGIGVSVDHARLSSDMPPPHTSARFTDGEQRCSFDGAVEVTCWVDHPVKVIDGGVTAILARYDATCAIVAGALQCWGANAQGQLGIAPSGTDIAKPTQSIASGVGYVAISQERTCAMVDGAMRCNRPCTLKHDKLECPSDPGFDAGDPLDLSDLEARLGVWRGTIGGQAVMVRLLRGESDYYYLRHMHTIALTNADKHGRLWNEGAAGKPAATWKLQSPAGDLLDGEWADADGQRTLPIRLQRVTIANDRGEGRDTRPVMIAYNAPRVAAQELKIEESSGRYRTISVLDGRISMLELTDDTPSANVFNTAMREWRRDEIMEYYACDSETGNGDEFYGKLQIDWQAGPWLLVREGHENSCGGVHWGDTEFQTWNLTTGKSIDPWTWIRDSEMGCEHCHGAPAQLNAMLLAAAQRNKNSDECAGEINGNNRYRLRPAQDGLLFSPDLPRATTACAEDIEVPYAQLLPFATSAGKQAIASLMSATAKKSHSPDVPK